MRKSTATWRLPDAEYHRRWRAAQDQAREQGLDALLVWSKGGGGLDCFWDVFYLAGFYSTYPWYPDSPPDWSGRAFSAVLLPADGEPSLVVDIPDWRRDLVPIEDVRFSVTVVSTVAELLKERGLEAGRVGLVGTYLLPVGMYDALREAAPHVAFEPADRVLEDLQAVKSPLELDLVREAAEVGTAMVDAVMTAALQPGVTEAEAVAAGHEVGVRLGAAPLQTPVASGPHSHAYAYGSVPGWTDRVLAAGDLFHIDNFGFVNGYLYDFGRGHVVGGRPNDDQRAILQAAVDAVNAGIAVIRPGVPASAVHDAVETVLRERDMCGDGGLQTSPALRFSMDGHGHGFGCGWGWPYIWAGEDRVFREGMCIAVETMAGRADIGSTYHEQGVIVHADSVELVSKARVDYW